MIGNLRPQAEALSAAFPPLLVRAERLATTVIMGEHGRRRSGMGETFWQYRPATPQDDARKIDWRRSARSDAAFVQDKEWQIAQTLSIWVDQSASMDFTSAKGLETKRDRARLLGLASAILMLKGGERVGLCQNGFAARRGLAQIESLTAALSRDTDQDMPEIGGLAPHSKAIFISDFLDDVTVVESALKEAAAKGISGVLLQILDPAEETFPYFGRTLFEDMRGQTKFETLKAKDLRPEYLERLGARKDQLERLAQQAGWQFTTHHTDQSATQALLWLYASVERLQ